MSYEKPGQIYFHLIILVVAYAYSPVLECRQKYENRTVATLPFAGNPLIM
jgi:hypothetical protein